MAMEEQEEGGTYVWSWGAGNHGQLANGTFCDSWVPLSVLSLGSVVDSNENSLAGPRVRSIACGGAHGLAVQGEGQVVTWGRGQHGAIGHGDELNLSLPKLLLSMQGIRIRWVAAGWNHSALVADCGELYTCGSGSFGQLGHGDLEGRLVPWRVEAFCHFNVIMAACGMRHTLVLVDGPVNSTSVYAFGSCKRGQLGTSPTECDPSCQPFKKLVLKAVPQRVVALDQKYVVNLAANGDHSAALTGTGSLYVWGKGFNSTSDTHLPSPVGGNWQFTQVSLGWSHGLALAENGFVWAWGSNCRGQLGISHSETVMKATNSFLVESWPGLQLIGGLEGKKATCVSAGAEHSVVVLEDGTIMVWGWGEHGQLGLNAISNQTCPQKLTINADHMCQGRSHICRVFCGSGFTFALAQK